MSTSMPFDSRTQSPGYDIGPDEDRHFDSSQNNHNFRGGRFDFADFENTVSDHAQKEDFVEVFDETPRRSINMLTTDTTTRNLHKLYKEENRLKTFKGHWKDGYSVFPSDLARDGFIYCGPGDRVQCVFCSYRIWDWEPGDSVEREHRKYYPNCPFVCGQCEHLNIPIRSEADRNKYISLNHRKNSFLKWPKKDTVRCDTIAEAGFYYNVETNRFHCFSCGIIVDDWQPGEEPWKKHARNSPKCRHVVSIKGTDFVHQVHNEINLSNSVADEPAMGGNMTNVPAGASPAGEQLEQTRSLCFSQEMGNTIDVDLESSCVKAVMLTYDVPEERMREMLTEMRMTKGVDHVLTLDDFDDLINQLPGM